jgi:hypothetical protein
MPSSDGYSRDSMGKPMVRKKMPKGQRLTPYTVGDMWEDGDKKIARKLVERDAYLKELKARVKAREKERKKKK